MNNELLPCPFCGGKPELISFCNAPENESEAWIECMSCKSSCGESFDWDYSKAVSLAGDIWNTRCAPEGKTLIPIEPTDALLRSMTVRYDHGLGCPGYYDQPLFKRNISHQERLESTMRTMRQLHEEVVGAGFYKVED